MAHTDRSGSLARLTLNPNPCHHDLIAALLRLHHDGRGEAASAARSLPAAARFALDGIEPTRRLLRSGREGPAAWWIAAERSRATYAASEAPQLSGDIKMHTWQENGRTRRSWYARFAVTTTNTDRPTEDQPTELKAQTSDQWGGGYTSRFLGDWIPAMAAIWPHHAEHFLALTCLPVLESPSWTETAHDVPRTLDALARHPNAWDRWRRPSSRLASRQRSVTIDSTPSTHSSIWLLPVESRCTKWPRSWRATPRHGLRPGGPSRWRRLPRHPAVPRATVDSLTHLLPQLPADHRGLNKLLDVLRDELIRLGRSPSDTVLTRWLGDLSGSSAAAKTARLLLG